MSRKLGRKPHDPRRLARVPHLHAYATGTLPEPPPVIDWSRNMAPGSWGMCLNDAIGDCTAAAVAHAYATWESFCPPLTFMTDDEVVQIYEATGGYRPSSDGTITSNATDGGAVCLDVLHYWNQQGVPLAGQRDKLTGFCQIDPKHQMHVKQGVWLFGCLYVGLNLTVAQQDQDVWDLCGDTTPWGGHCVLVAGADEKGLTCISWGKLQPMTWRFWAASVDEVYPLLSSRWVDFDGSPVSPGNFRFNDLQQDLNLLASAAT